MNWVGALLDSVFLVRDHVIRIEDLVQDFVQWFLTRKVLVVQFRITCGEDPAKVFHSIELMHSF